MYDKGPHIVLRRDGVCIVAKTPDGDMPQIEYWVVILHSTPPRMRCASLT